MYSVHEKTYYIFIYVLCTWTNLLYLYLCTRLPVFYHGSLWFRILPRLGGLYMPKAVITRHYKLLLSPTLNGKTHIMFVNGVVCNLLYTILSQKTGVSRKTNIFSSGIRGVSYGPDFEVLQQLGLWFYLNNLLLLFVALNMNIWELQQPCFYSLSLRNWENADKGFRQVHCAFFLGRTF